MIKKMLHSQTDGYAEVKDALDAWVVGLNHGQVDDILQLYDKDSILVPTLSDKICKTNDERYEYFSRLKKIPGLKVALKQHDLRVFGDIAINSGTYAFSYREDDKIIELPARFSFTYAKKDEEWLIVDHHSSKEPEGF